MTGNNIISNNFSPTYNNEEHSGVLAQFYAISESYPYLYKIGQISDSTGSKITAKNIKIFLSDTMILNLNNGIKTSNDQLNDLRNRIGLNITEIANILQVKRPTIYEWLESSNKPTPKNQQRLDIIYAIFNPLLSDNATELKNYLYVKTEKGTSLFDLLTEHRLNEEIITTMIQKIQITILSSRKQAAELKAALHHTGFKPVSQDHKKKVLNRLIRRIG